jgi:HSP20 family protein
MLFGDRSERGAGAVPRDQSVPVNVFEAEDFLLVIVPMPGLQEEDIDITMSGNIITLASGERADLKPESGKRYLRHEWHYGPYQRTLELPYAIDAESAEATFGNGVLTVRVQKAETERSHRIPVKTTSPSGAGQPGAWQAGEPTRQP